MGIKSLVTAEGTVHNWIRIMIEFDNDKGFEKAKELRNSTRLRKYKSLNYPEVVSVMSIYAFPPAGSWSKSICADFVSVLTELIVASAELQAHDEPARSYVTAKS